MHLGVGAQSRGQVGDRGGVGALLTEITQTVLRWYGR